MAPVENRIRQRAQTKINSGPNMRRLLETYEGTSGPNAHKKKKDEYHEEHKLNKY